MQHSEAQFPTFMLECPLSRTRKLFIGVPLLKLRVSFTSIDTGLNASFFLSHLACEHSTCAQRPPQLTEMHLLVSAIGYESPRGIIKVSPLLLRKLLVLGCSHCFLYDLRKFYLYSYFFKKNLNF